MESGAGTAAVDALRAARDAVAALDIDTLTQCAHSTTSRPRMTAQIV